MDDVVVRVPPIDDWLKTENIQLLDSSGRPESTDFVLPVMCEADELFFFSRIRRLVEHGVNSPLLEVLQRMGKELDSRSRLGALDDEDGLDEPVAGPRHASTSAAASMSAVPAPASTSAAAGRMQTRSSKRGDASTSSAASTSAAAGRMET
ncbi:hypothetical protein MKEN_00834300 [Mycena kentingensis (nom. inval.)]|nr:hypothetical protein MKEN_00834300 [Mycena kentingensis (nom. inval.)]